MVPIRQSRTSHESESQINASDSVVFFFFCSLKNTSFLRRRLHCKIMNSITVFDGGFSVLADDFIYNMKIKAIN